MTCFRVAFKPVVEEGREAGSGFGEDRPGSGGQFQEQATTAVQTLQEERKDWGQVGEESKWQLASLAEAKLASLIDIWPNGNAGNLLNGNLLARYRDSMQKPSL